MPHPALVERRIRAIFDDPDLGFDDVSVFDQAPFIVIDQHFRRGAERPLVYYDEYLHHADFDALLIMFDSLLIPFDDAHRFQPNFSARNSRDSRRQRPAVVVLS